MRLRASKFFLQRPEAHAGWRSFKHGDFLQQGFEFRYQTGFAIETRLKVADDLRCCRLAMQRAARREIILQRPDQIQTFFRRLLSFAAIVVLLARRLRIISASNEI